MSNTTDNRKPYCGIGPITKGKRRGTVSECENMNQVRYYGIVKTTAPEKKKKLTEKEKVEKSIAQNKEVTYDDILPYVVNLHHLLDQEKELEYKIEVLEVRQDNGDKSASERAKAKKELAEKKQELAKAKAEFEEKRAIYRILLNAYEEGKEKKKAK